MVLQVIQKSNIVFKAAIPSEALFKHAYSLALKNKMFLDSISLGFLDVDPQLIEMKTTVLLNLAVCYIKKKSDQLALDLLREVK